MKHRFLTTLLLLAIFIGAKAQYSNTYESLDPNNNSVPVIAQTSLQSVIAHPSGSLTINKTQAGNPVLAFLKNNGNPFWSVEYSDQSEQLTLYSGALTEDHNFIVVGAYGKQGVALKIDASTGTVLWSNFYSPDDHSYSLEFSAIVRSPEALEMYIVAGKTMPDDPAAPAGFYALNMLGAGGQTLWAAHYLDTSGQYPARLEFPVSHIAVNPHSHHPNGNVLIAGHQRNSYGELRLFTIGINHANGNIQKPYEEMGHNALSRHPHITFDATGEYFLYFGHRETVGALKTMNGLGSLDFGHYYLVANQYNNLEGCTGLPNGNGYKLTGWGNFLPGASYPFLFELDSHGVPFNELYYYNKLGIQATLSSAVLDLTAQHILFHGSTEDDYTESNLNFFTPEGNCPLHWGVEYHSYPFWFTPLDLTATPDHGVYSPIDFTAAFYGAHIYTCSGEQLARPALTATAASVEGTLALAPNPTEGLLTLDGRAFAADQFLTIRDLTGKVVLTTTLAARQQQTLDVAGLPAGLYLITSADQQVAIRFAKK